MATKMNDLKNSQQSNLSTAVRNSLKPACWIPLTAAVLFSSYSYAIGLQEIQVKSNLGEPLNATVIITTPPTSTLSADCFTVLPATSGADFPNISDATARLTRVNGGYAVNITSKEPVREPISSITLASNCSALPILERSYTMVLDPAGVREERVAQEIYSPRNNTRTATALNSTRSQAVRRTTPRNNRSSIQQNTSYQIQGGDSLSSIAARIQNIPENSIWSVAASILATNPKAFINNNPDLIIQGRSLAIPSFTAEFVPSEQAALNSITKGSSPTLNIQPASLNGVVANTSLGAPLATSRATNTRYTPVQTSNQALSTMTLSTSLSVISLERIEARANGQTVSASLLPNTKSLFGSGQEESPQSPLQTAATSLKQAVEPKVIYVDRPAYPSEIDQRINTGITDGLAKVESEASFDFGQLMKTVLGTLLGLGLLSWFLVRPFIKRKNRLAFIREVRAHKKKRKYINRNMHRKSALNRLPVNKSSLSSQIDEITNTVSAAAPDLPPAKTEDELQQHAADIEAAFTAANQLKSPASNLDTQVVINKNHAPRESNVAQEIYEVGTIDDTGELVSLTKAFPELEAELNARLGGKIPNLGKDLDTEANAETMTVQFQSPLDELAALTKNKDAETMTVQFERPLEDIVDFELPNLMENLEGDFESVVKDGDFASTMVFNEEIFNDDGSINPFDEDTTNSTTMSTESIDSEGETRISEVMIDGDGLKASDFGLDDDDFPADKDDYRYLEPDASINAPGINLSAEELEELGLDDDDDNIVPFSKVTKNKKS